MMGGQHTTYDSITKTTTTEADGTGMIPLVQQEEHETGGGTLLEGEVGAAATDGRRRDVLVRRSMIQTRAVAAILVGAAVLLVALSTMDFGGGIGSVGSLVSSRSTSRTDTDRRFGYDYSYSGYDDTINPPWVPDDYFFPPEDYDYDSGYDDGIDINVIEEDILTAEELEAWRKKNGISGDKGDCDWCNHYNCHTGMPAPPDDNYKCNHNNYQCQYYTDCGKLPGNRPQPGVVIADESQCQQCYSKGCATGRPTVSGDENTRDTCNYLHCPDYANCEHDFPCADYYTKCASVPRTQGGTEVRGNGRGGLGPIFLGNGRGRRGKHGEEKEGKKRTGKSSKSGKAFGRYDW